MSISAARRSGARRRQPLPEVYRPAIRSRAGWSTAFIATLAELARRSGARQVHEVGCGEGFLSTMLAARGLVVRGSDLSPSAVAIARGRAAALGLPVSFRVADLHELTPDPDGAELVVCCEVLEHLADPARALACSRVWRSRT